MTWTINVDAAACLGSGMCAGARPDAFTLDGPKARPLTPTADPDESLLDIADSCPAAAITITDADGGELAPRD
ncbi:ferredoxin [Actinokineospora pegani]|uniref:ferredoxin n=1 Tax=Actinokineospora pegani TaxID=2654637 RepID=UPI0018D3C963|nr:ferredoxin [Actinokineospora pegani]